MTSEAFSEEYLKHVAEKKGISTSEASQLIDQCIKDLSAAENIEYAEIYNIVFSPEHLEKCLKKSKMCSDLAIEECKKSCLCFYHTSQGCLPRKFPDAEKINENPDRYIQENLSKTEDLKRFLEVAAYLYYNYDGGGLSDNAYDALEYHYKKRERLRGRAYEKIGAPPVEKIRADLPYGMPSLDKIKPGMTETQNFLSRFRPREGGSTPTRLTTATQCVWSVKLDGVSGMVVYDNGQLSKIYTRGDGLVGGDVTYLQEYIKSIPSSVSHSSGPFVVRGEFILSKETWQKKYHETYSNARAFVSGKINAGFASQALHDIEFVAYEIMVMPETKDIPPPEQAFRILDAEGFRVVENGIFESPTLFQVIETYKLKRVSSLYYIDGLVLDENAPRPSVPPASQGIVLPTARAFKMTLEEQMRKTKIINVEWNISRYGRYVPVAIYEAVYVDGVRMTRATAHNARHVQDWNMGKGTKVVVVRSGDVIPQIKDVEVNPDIIPIFPATYDDGGYEWHWERSDIVLDDIEGNKEVAIKRTVHFFETIGVPRLRQKTAEKMYDHGLSTPEKIVSASVADLMKIKGIGKKTAEFFDVKIRETIMSVPPDRFIVASTTFKSGVGSKLLKTLFRKYPNIMNLSGEEIRTRLLSDKLKGFGPARIKTISEGIPQFRAYLDSFAKEYVQKSIDNYVQRMEQLKQQGYNPLVKDKKFVLTGFMGRKNYELEDYIYDHQGDFLSSVTSDTEAVISGNVLEVSKKMIEAASKNIPVLTLEEFALRYNVPLTQFSKEEEE